MSIHAHACRLDAPEWNFRAAVDRKLFRSSLSPASLDEARPMCRPHGKEPHVAFSTQGAQPTTSKKASCQSYSPQEQVLPAVALLENRILLRLSPQVEDPPS